MVRGLHKNNDRFVKNMELNPEITVDELIDEFRKAGAFGAGRLGLAADILEKMFREEKLLKFLGLAGALIPAGIRRIISLLINDDLIDVLVTTGASITHDLVEALGGRHEKADVQRNDTQLRELGINRIFDIYVRDSAFETLEDNIQAILSNIDEERREEGLAVYELIWEIGKQIKDQYSIVRCAFKKKIPIFCPAITDSILGLQLWLFRQREKLNIDVIKDLQKIIEMAYESKKAGVIVLGGGVPKNHILQTMLITGRGFDYAIQITTDRPESGGLSGASLQEAQSWGKIKSDALWVDVIADATIAFPMIVASALKRLKY